MARYASLNMVILLFAIVFASSAAEIPQPTELERRLFKGEISFAATNKYIGIKFGYLPTNTVAFEKYAMKAMLEHINLLNEAWGIGLAKPVNMEGITAFGAYPRTRGFTGGITFSNRFAFAFENGKFERFNDLKFSGRALIPRQSLPEPEFQKALEEKREMAADWVENGKALSRTEALRLARRTLKEAGYDEKALKLQGPIMRQEKLHIQGKLRDLPLWEVQWYYNNSKNNLPVMMQVSGMTTNVVEYFSTFEKTLPMPDNYYDLLGLPDPRKKQD